MSFSGQVARRKAPPSIAAIFPVLGMVLAMWVIEFVDSTPGVDLDQYGIRPRDPDGLIGIVAAPLLHADFSHLMANTGAFLVLGALIVWTTKRFWRVTIGVAVLGGLATWLTAGEYSIHIGASGLVYGYAAFLVAWGVFTRRLMSLVVAVVVVVMYGGIVWGVLPGQPGISWQGHLFGALAGAFMAWRMSRRR